MQLGTKEKVHIEQQKKVLSKTEQGSVKGKESWVSTACTIPSTECHNMMCCNKVYAVWILWKFKRKEPTLTLTQTCT